MAASRQVWTRYYYDGLNIVMTRESSAATGGAGSWLTRRAYTLKQASIGQIVAEHTATAWNAATGRPSAWTHRFYHFDLLGNTTAETDANGMVANIIDMEAFGTVLQGGQAGFRLTTKEYDPEAGAYYFNARWYQPGVGPSVPQQDRLVTVVFRVVRMKGTISGCPFFLGLSGVLATASQLRLEVVSEECWATQLFPFTVISKATIAA